MVVLNFFANVSMFARIKFVLMKRRVVCPELKNGLQFLLLIFLY